MKKFKFIRKFLYFDLEIREVKISPQTQPLNPLNYLIIFFSTGLKKTCLKDILIHGWATFSSILLTCTELFAFYNFLWQMAPHVLTRRSPIQALTCTSDVSIQSNFGPDQINWFQWRKLTKTIMFSFNHFVYIAYAIKKAQKPNTWSVFTKLNLWLLTWILGLYICISETEGLIEGLKRYI